MRDRRCIRTTTVAACMTLLLSGVCTGTTIDLAENDVPVIIGETAGDLFGQCMGVGDLDGDGVPELFVGAPGRVGDDGVPHTGAVYVFELSAVNALSTALRATDITHGTVEGTDARGRFGSSMVVADLDGDGVDDLAVGAPSADGATVAAGAVSIWFGGRAQAWSDGAAPDAVLTGTSAGARLGSTLLAADLDDDGTPELLATAPGGGPGDGEGRGVAYVLTGPALRSAPTAAPVAEIAAAAVVGASPGDALEGLCVADTDADERPELLLGSYRASGEPDGPADAGAVYRIPAAEVLSRAVTFLPTQEGRRLDGPTGRGFFGRSISAGDVDGDDIDDVLVSAYASKAERKRLTAAGEVFLLFGGDGVAFGERSLDDPDVVRLRGRSNSDVLGFPVLLDDLDGDGLDDVLASARYSDGPERGRRDCGEICVFRGSLRSVVAAKVADIDQADIVVVGAQENDSIGESLLVLDADGGEPELFVGAPDATRPDAGGDPTVGCGAVFVVPGELMRR